MNETQVLLSQLAVDQLSNLKPKVGRTMIQTLTRLTVFPQSGSPLLVKGYEMYKQVVVKGHRAIYRYFPDEKQVRIYCILHTRRQLPAPELLIYQLF